LVFEKIKISYQLAFIALNSILKIEFHETRFEHNLNKFLFQTIIWFVFLFIWKILPFILIFVLKIIHFLSDFLIFYENLNLLCWGRFLGHNSCKVTIVCEVLWFRRFLPDFRDLIIVKLLISRYAKELYNKTKLCTTLLHIYLSVVLQNQGSKIREKMTKP